MEFRGLCLVLAFCVLAFASYSTEARLAARRRVRSVDYQSDSSDYADEAPGYDTQNDGDADDEETVERNATILTKPETYDINIGLTVRLSCKLNDTGVVNWVKNGDEKLFIGTLPVHSNRAKYEISGTDLVIKDAELTDSGNYSCILQQVGAQEVINHTVVIRIPPRITKFTATNNGNVREGQTLELVCEVSGTPTPSIYWARSKDDGATTENLKFSDGEMPSGSHSFIIRSIRREDAGVYYCYAIGNNKARNAAASIVVHVHGRPIVKIEKARVNGEIGLKTVFECQDKIKPTPSFQWLLNDNTVESYPRDQLEHEVNDHGHTHRSTLTVIPHSDAAFGTYTCVGKNEHGSHHASVELVETPVVEGLRAEGNNLTWTTHSHQKLLQFELNIKNESTILKTIPVALEGSQKGHEFSHHHAIHDPSLEGNYTVTVKVENSKGWSQESDAVPVYLEKEALTLIQTASVFSSSGTRLAGSSAIALVSTILMYLLVRTV